jgi:spore coat protein U-like protein
MRSARKLFHFCLSVFLCLNAAPSSHAATATTTFSVSLTIVASCTVSAAALGFASSGLISAAIDATTTATVTCTNTTPYNVGLDAGAGSGATVGARKMTSGGATVTYSLYQDASRLTAWGFTAGTNTVAGTGNGTAQVLTIYGRVPAQATPAPATYTDTITVTVTY